MLLTQNRRSQTPITTLPTLQNRHTHNTAPLHLQAHTHSVVTPGFVGEPHGDGRAAFTLVQPHGRKTNQVNIGPPPCHTVHFIGDSIIWVAFACTDCIKLLSELFHSLYNCFVP